MADAAAAAPAAARERLAAGLRELGAALSRKAQPGLAPEVQELIESWDLRCRALLDAANSAADGLPGEAAAAAAAAELLQPLLSGAFVSAHPDLFTPTVQAVKSAILLCCSTEASAYIFGPVAASLLDLFLSEQISWQIRRAAAELLVILLARRDCAAWLLAAPSAASAINTLIAAAKREGKPQQDSAFAVLAALAAADAATAERAGSPEAALLPLAVERIRSITVCRPYGSMGSCDFGPLRLLRALMSTASTVVCERAQQVPGLACAVIDLLMVLGSDEWAAMREELGVMALGQLESEILVVLAGLMASAPLNAPAYATLLSSRGALPRVLALLRSPSEQARRAASFCLAEVVGVEAGRDALFNVPRAASELAAALRRAHAEGEDPLTTQCHAACALMRLVCHSRGRRVAEALVRAAAAEGRGGSLLGALAGLIAASADDEAVAIHLRRRMCYGSVAVLNQMLLVGMTAEQLRVVRQAPRLAAACVAAMQYWADAEASDDQMCIVDQLVVTVAVLAGLEQLGRTPGAQPAAATADTAAGRAALRRAPGMEGMLRRFLMSPRPPSEDALMAAAELAAKWLLRLPEVKAAAAAALTPSAAMAAAAAAPTAAGPASAAPTAAQAQAAAAAPSAAASGRSAAAQQPQPEAGSSGGGAEGSSGCGSGASGASGIGAEPAALPRACGGCGKSAADEAPLLRCVACKAQWYCGDASSGAAVTRDAAAAADGAAAGAGPRPRFWGFSWPSFSGDKCAKAKPTLILLSGVGGSQLNATSSGSGSCPPLVNSSVLWYADHWYFDEKLPCFAQYMSLQYDPVTKRYSNASGTEVVPDDGPSPGGLIPRSSKQRLFYALLWAHLSKAHGYVPGRDLFYVPYDWRIGVQGLEQRGGLEGIARRIEGAVRRNCGQKAVVITHSYGGNVLAAMLHNPQFQEWKDANVRGWVPVGAPFGGCAATNWISQLSGDFFKLFPIIANALLPPEVTSKWHPTVVGKSLYKLAFGLPTWGWMAPRPEVLGRDHVLVSTPTRNYTVGDQRRLLLDMGDKGGAALLEDSWARSRRVLELGPVPGVETHCLYGVGIPTSATLVFNESVPQRAPIPRPYRVVDTPGDGVVDAASLRLCGRFAPKENIVEVSAPLVDHATILAHPKGLLQLSTILGRLGVPYSGGGQKLLVNLLAG
ncbi:phosphatidylcholine-sterol acyltransferase [Raphidocelis subcapitata]|uniref:Phosphatidylcholine-sterol acyltransferase n=1 Tax=Raphidocelis subcapitata TaxID=307507 RepID=A0A2V0PQZ6_9CHLO|nr:phosphatidylcholine-sterol acyltransferase [Raphidocelis subcapitata]|eukprot:GBG00634.1 phosphatidylcholine-sterol acyltransferase [Raphidocelis subcapitata]